MYKYFCALLFVFLHMACAQSSANVSEIWPKLPKKIRHQQHKVSGGLRIISQPLIQDQLADLNIYLIIPQDPYYLPSFYKVAPGIQLAVMKIQEQGILPGHAIHVTYRDSQCSNSYAPAQAVEAYKEDAAHVFVGPTCEYALAPVARLLRFWNLPLITAGGLTKDFAEDKTTNASEYFLLTRTGYTFLGYSRTITTFMKNNSWQKVKLMYESNAYREVTGEKTCYLTMSSLVVVLKEERLSYNSYEIGKDPQYTVAQYMRKEIGNEYATSRSNATNRCKVFKGVLCELTRVIITAPRRKCLEQMTDHNRLSGVPRCHAFYLYSLDKENETHGPN